MSEQRFEDYEPESRADWRRWLAEHHATSPGVWLIWRKRPPDRRNLSLNDAVEEALCFGWIDSRVRPLDDECAALRFTPRRRRSTWSALNRARVAALSEQGLMTVAGRRAVEAAQDDGSWALLDAVEALRIPDDLTAAFEADATAAENFAALSASARKQMLWWILSAKRPQTRARRISEVVRLAAANLTLAERLRQDR